MAYFYFFSYPGTSERRPVGPHVTMEEAEQSRASHAQARPQDNVSPAVEEKPYSYIQQWYAELTSPLTDPSA